MRFKTILHINRCSTENSVKGIFVRFIILMILRLLLASFSMIIFLIRQLIPQLANRGAQPAVFSTILSPLSLLPPPTFKLNSTLTVGERASRSAKGAYVSYTNMEKWARLYASFSRSSHGYGKRSRVMRLLRLRGVGVQR